MSVTSVLDMNVQVIGFTYFITLYASRTTLCYMRDFTVCHEDFGFNMSDGIISERYFTWLAFIQYVHVSSKAAHKTLAPRVVLIHKQFMLGTAAELLHAPKDYIVGNVVFGEYEQDEEACKLTKAQANMGIQCPPAYLETPVAKVIAHPEYEKFGVLNSVALVKLIQPLKSHYMIPVCLPTYHDRTILRKSKMVLLVDYMSTVPIDFDEEKMAKKTLKFQAGKTCRRHRRRSGIQSEMLSQILCTTGCGVRVGAPIISHTHIGSFELVGLGLNGTKCLKKSMRATLNKDPPVFLDVYPYVSWIVNTITAHIMPFSRSHNFKLVNSETGRQIIKPGYLRRRKKHKSGWKGHLYVSGNFCYSSSQYQRTTGVVFYHERFEVNTYPYAKLRLNMQISAGVECTIVCVRLLLPSRHTDPIISGVGGYNISIRIHTEWFPYQFYYTMGLVGINSTDTDFKEWLEEHETSFWN